MDQTLIEIFKRFRFLKFQDLVDLYKISKLNSFAAGEMIVRKGDHYDCILGIRKGIIRTYILTSEGDERTVRFAKESEFTAAFNTTLHNKPSTEYIQAVVDCKVVQINLRKVKELAETNIRIARLWSGGLQEALEDTIQRIEFFVGLNPEERYRQLLLEKPDLLDRVPQKYLASYIGVTTVSLSRIRKRVAES